MVRIHCENRRDVRCRPQVEGFVVIKTLSIFDESLDERVELQRGASATATPLSAVTRLRYH